MKIEIDQDIVNHLVVCNKRDESLVQTLRRLLRLSPVTSVVATRVERKIEPVTRRGVLADLLIDVLDELAKTGTTVKASVVVETMAKRLALTKVDRNRVEPGTQRWKKDVHFVRHALAHSDDPLLETPQRGCWSLTAKGRAEVVPARERLREITDKKTGLISLNPPETPRR